MDLSHDRAIAHGSFISLLWNCTTVKAYPVSVRRANDHGAGALPGSPAAQTII